MSLFKIFSQKFKSILPLTMIVLALTIAAFEAQDDNFSYSQTVDLKNTKHLNTDININGGTLTIGTHASSLVEFKSWYSKPFWKAKLKPDSANSNLIIYQPDIKYFPGNDWDDSDKNDWNIKIPDNLPTDLKIGMGGGSGNIDLSDSKLQTLKFDAVGGTFNFNLTNTPLSNLDITVVGGALEIDLSGKHAKNLKAIINGPIGSIKLVFPRLASVRVNVVTGGIINPRGFTKHDDYYVNEFYGKAENSIDVMVTSGMGVVELTLK